jgi:hypothetical protein
MNPSPKKHFTLSSVVCITFGHDYIITRKVTNHINEYRCSHCGREVADNDHGSLEPLTQKLKNANSTLAVFFQKKKRRVSAA